MRILFYTPCRCLQYLVLSHSKHVEAEPPRVCCIKQSIMQDCITGIRDEKFRFKNVYNAEAEACARATLTSKECTITLFVMFLCQISTSPRVSSRIIYPEERSVPNTQEKVGAQQNRSLFEMLSAFCVKINN